MANKERLFTITTQKVATNPEDRNFNRLLERASPVAPLNMQRLRRLMDTEETKRTKNTAKLEVGFFLSSSNRMLNQVEICLGEFFVLPADLAEKEIEVIRVTCLTGQETLGLTQVTGYPINAVGRLLDTLERVGSNDPFLNTMRHFFEQPPVGYQPHGFHHAGYGRGGADLSNDD